MSIKEFFLSERFRLELHWENVNYEIDGVCKLKNAYFCGPVLSIAKEINSNEYISIDFSSQYFIISKHYYVAKLDWGKVTYDNNIVILKDCVISHNVILNKVPKFRSGDFLIIDTQGHEEAEHPSNFVYNAYLVNRDGVLYNFNK